MTEALHHVTRAALPVAILLLSLTLAARCLLWAQLDHAPARRIARQYLEPLSTWCLIATGVYTLALILRADAELVAFVVPVALAAAAVLLRTVGEPSPDEPEPEPVTRSAPAVPPPPAPAQAANLWASSTRGESTPVPNA
jgi:hypothetical protein